MRGHVIGQIALQTEVLADEALQSASLPKSTIGRMHEAREALRPWVARYGQDVLGIEIRLGSRILVGNGSVVLSVECPDAESPVMFDEAHFWRCLMEWTRADHLPPELAKKPVPDLASGGDTKANRSISRAVGCGHITDGATTSETNVDEAAIVAGSVHTLADPAAPEVPLDRMHDRSEGKRDDQCLTVSAGAASELANTANRRLAYDRRTVTVEPQLGVVQELIDLHELRQGKRHLFTDDAEFASLARAGSAGHHFVATWTGQMAFAISKIKVAPPLEESEEGTES